MSQFPVSDPAGGHNPFASSPPGYPPPPKSRVWLWVLLGAGGAAALVCCGCAGFGWLGWNVSTRVLGTELVQQLNADATAQQELGKVLSADLDVMATAKATQESDGRQVMVFRVTGDKASGEVHAEQTGGGKGKLFRNARLIMPGKKEVALGF